jgi:hypothetical protein
MAKYFRRQDTKTQRIFEIIQTKFFFSVFVATADKMDRIQQIFNLRFSISVYPG